ncbi:hypothetical protein PybrP1_001400, partial [[Pythium] brassicae (nom. inval.)]
MIEKVQQFNTSTEALYVVQDHALREKKSVRVAGQGGSHKFIMCASPECSFVVRLYKWKGCTKLDSNADSGVSGQLESAKESRGDVEAAFALVPSFLVKFEELSPGSVTAFEQDDCGRFSWPFLQPHTSAHALPFAQRIVHLDVALVDKETIENYDWFFALCVKGGIEFAYPL